MGSMKITPTLAVIAALLAVPAGVALTSSALADDPEPATPPSNVQISGTDGANSTRSGGIDSAGDDVGDDRGRDGTASSTPDDDAKGSSSNNDTRVVPPPAPVSDDDWDDDDGDDDGDDD